MIVGAGPAGLVLALLLAQAGIHSTILEARPGLHPGLRATQYGSPATRVFRKAGLLKDIRKVSYDQFPGIKWRRTKDLSEVVSLDLSITENDEDRMTVLSLKEILKIALRHVEALPGGLVQILWEHKAVGLGEDSDCAWLEAELPDGTKSRFEGDYVVACDGGKSTIRTLLFGHDWPGITHDKELFVQNVRERIFLSRV